MAGFSQKLNERHDSEDYRSQESVAARKNREARRVGKGHEDAGSGWSNHPGGVGGLHLWGRSSQEPAVQQEWLFACSKANWNECEDSWKSRKWWSLWCRFDEEHSWKWGSEDAAAQRCCNGGFPATFIKGSCEESNKGQAQIDERFPSWRSSFCFPKTTPQERSRYRKRLPKGSLVWTWNSDYGGGPEPLDRNERRDVEVCKGTSSKCDSRGGRGLWTFEGWVQRASTRVGKKRQQERVQRHLRMGCARRRRWGVGWRRKRRRTA